MQVYLIVGGVLFLLGATVATVLTLFVGVLIAVGVGISVMVLGAGIFFFFNEKDFDKRALAMGASVVGGLLLGASAGALVGSVVLGLGTVLGAIAGSLIGLALPVVGLLLIASLIACIQGGASKIATFHGCSGSSSPSLLFEKSTAPSTSSNDHSTTKFFSQRNSDEPPVESISHSYYKR